jgi:hypothetical protein
MQLTSLFSSWTRLLRRHRPRRGGRQRLRLEVLEQRTTPDAITWTNRGITSGPNNDYFNDTFGANANLARSVVGAAVDLWGGFTGIIQDLNGAGINGTLPMTISMSSNPLDRTRGSSANTSFYANGMPSSASIVIGRGSDGHGASWFLDPNPIFLCNSAFLGAVTGPTCGYAQPGSPALGKDDLMEAAIREIAHGLGYGNTPRIRAHATDTGIVDHSSGGGVGHYWAYVGTGLFSTFSTLLTSFDSGSDVGGPANAAAAGDPAYPVRFGGRNYYGTDDDMNPFHSTGQRRYMSRNDINILLDAYGYDPGTSSVDFTDNFYAFMDETNKVWIRGRQDAASTDTINLTYRHVPMIGNYFAVTVALSNPVPGTNDPGPYELSFYGDGRTVRERESVGGRQG